MDIAANGLVFPTLTWGSHESRPVLLLHGFPQEPATWQVLASALAADGLRLIAPFQRGYVASTRSPGPQKYNFTQFVDDALGIMDSLEIKYCDVIGFGMGAMQAWMLAARAPHRIRSLIALRYPHPAAFALGFKSSSQQQRWKLLQTQLGDTDAEARVHNLLKNNGIALRRFLAETLLPQPFIERYMKRLLDPNTLLGALAWQGAIAIDEFKDIPSVDVPTLYIWSDGPGLARETAEATAYFTRGLYREIFLAGLGNFILETASEKLLQPIREHLLIT